MASPVSLGPAEAGSSAAHARHGEAGALRHDAVRGIAVSSSQAIPQVPHDLVPRGHHLRGMRCIALLSTWPAASLAAADLLVRDLSALRWTRSEWGAFAAGAWHPSPPA